MWTCRIGQVAKTFVKLMRAFHAEPSVINRDRIAGDGAPAEVRSPAAGPEAAAHLGV
jgi:hypothetical protein